MSTVEWAGLLVVVAGIVTAVIFTADLPGQVAGGVKYAVCKVFQGTSCEAPDAGGTPVAEEDPGAADSAGNPLTEFTGGAFGRLSDSVQSAGCLLHLCGGGRFGEGWRNAGDAITPFASDRRLDCREWAGAEEAPPSRPDGSPRERAQIGTFNMYGNVGHGGVEEPIVSAIERSVDERDPTFLALNEVCENQAQALDARLDGYRVYFAPIDQINGEGGREVQTCDNDAAYGNAVLYREDFADDMQGRPHDLGTPDREGSHEKRGMACVSSASQGTVFCAAHLTSEGGDDGDEARAAEGRNISDILARDYAGQTVLLGGDFNASPGSDSLDGIYDPRYGGGAHGDLKEADSTGGFLGNCRTGEKTHGESGFGPFNFGGSKIDYIFTSTDVEIHDTDATQSADSDHDPVWSDVTF
ncbi:MAG: endonuclease/exonuclease/phosphatase family protein [Actinomadura sp.]